MQLHAQDGWSGKARPDKVASEHLKAEGPSINSLGSMLLASPGSLLAGRPLLALLLCVGAVEAAPGMRKSRAARGAAHKRLREQKRNKVGQLQYPSNRSPTDAGASRVISGQHVAKAQAGHGLGQQLAARVRRQVCGSRLREKQPGACFSMPSTSAPLKAPSPKPKAHRSVRQARIPTAAPFAAGLPCRLLRAFAQAGFGKKPLAQRRRSGPVHGVLRPTRVAQQIVHAGNLPSESGERSGLRPANPNKK